MAFPLPTKLNYKELFGDDTNNPFGTETKAGYGAVFNNWRVEARPPTVDQLLTEVVADFTRPIGGIGQFVEELPGTSWWLMGSNPITASRGGIRRTASSCSDTKAM
jgi:hypothetical protein